MDIEVKNLWDGSPCNHEPGVKIHLEKSREKNQERSCSVQVFFSVHHFVLASKADEEDWELDVKIEAPFYDDPQPPDASEDGGDAAKKGTRL